MNFSRKFKYEAIGSQEEFIAPLLRKELDNILRILAKDLKLKKEHKLKALDCGCGNQPLRDIIESLDFEYSSFDLSQNSLNTVDYICELDAPSKAFKGNISNVYDLVIATEVLEHISDWESAFSNLYSCTASNGYVLLTAPFFYPLHEEPFDYCRPTIYYFMKMSALFGFTVVSSNKLGTAVDVIGTTLGASRIVIKDLTSLRSRLLNRFIIRLQDYIFYLLLSYKSKLSAIGHGVYLSNIVVLRKQAHE